MQASSQIAGLEPPTMASQPVITTNGPIFTSSGTKRIRTDEEDDDSDESAGEKKGSLDGGKKSANNSNDDYEDYSSDNESGANRKPNIDSITSESESSSSSDCEEPEKSHPTTIIDNRPKSSSIPIGDPALVKQSQQFLASFQQQYMIQHHESTPNPLPTSYYQVNKPPMAHQYVYPNHHGFTPHPNYSQDQPPNHHPHNIMSIMFNKMQDAVANSPLLRTSSNASSTSTSSSISSVSDHHEGSSSSSSSVEGQLKALIMAAAANATNNRTSSSTSDGQTEDPGAVAAVAAAFADQFAFMVRSRSSSLSDCSSTSSSMCVSSSTTSCNSDHDGANNTEQLLQALKSSTIMKQMLSSYQAALTSNPTSKPEVNKAVDSPVAIKNVEVKKEPVKTNDPKPTGNNSQPVQGVMSPGTTPCKVCGDEASGFHYGVDSCEGCKGFFRRCITQGMNHQCTNQQQCEMTPFSRNSCQYCRLKKCFAVGMSREASRLGRRPKRPKDEKDMSFESTMMPPTTTSSFSTPSTTPLRPTDGSIKPINLENTPNDETAKAAKLKKEKIQYQPPFKLAADSFPDKHKENTSLLQPIDQVAYHPPPQGLLNHSRDDRSRTHTQNPIHSSHDIISHSMNNTKPEATSDLAPASNSQSQRETMHEIEILSKLISIADKHTSIERTNELEFIRTTLIEAHSQNWPTTMEKIRRRYAERPPIRVGTSASAGNEHVYRDCFVEAMVPLIMQVVKFCKKIPGFEHIAQPDQVQLLKQGSFEVICVNSLLLVDAQNRLMLTPDMEFLMDSNTIRNLPLGMFMNEVFELGVQASQLKLTDAEIAIYNAVLIMNPDRGDLQDKDRIEELQETLLHVLYKHLKHYRNDYSDLFHKLVKLMPTIRDINRRHSETLTTVRMTHPAQIRPTQ